ncbi:MAG: serine/threonine dehydratase [Rickettsiaceae bacterium]|nr:serine/threonine dehydratase [Rickettsiaceae bacterium]
MLILNPEIVKEAYSRISGYLINTPLIFSDILTNELGHNVYLKLDTEQVTGAFKVRAVLNHLLTLKEQGRLPKKVVAYTTGNHGIALGWAANLLNIEARIYVPNYVSEYKLKLIRQNSVELICTSNRQEAEEKTLSDGKNGFYYLHPSDSDYSIAGAGTMCYEALQENPNIDTIFASCGGGGLLAGSYLAKELVNQKALLFGVEPKNANDAHISIKTGKIFRLSESPETIADGLKTLSVSNRTFNYLQKLEDILLVEEEKIQYWTEYCINKLQIQAEPSCAISISAAYDWGRRHNWQEDKKNILILISGKNYQTY